MSTPNEPLNPQSGAPGQPGAGQPLGQGAVNGAPQGVPAGQQYGQGPVDGAPAGHQYGQAGGKYGTTEYNPNQYTGTMERPSTVDRLLKLTLVSLGLYILNGILGTVAANTVDYLQYFKDAGMSTEMAEQAAERATGFGGPVTAIISLLIGVGLYLLVYSGLKKGKNWARILGTVLASIAVLSGIYALFTTGMYAAPWNIVMIVLGLVKILVDILWIIAAFKAPTSAWFNQHRAQR